MSPQHVFISSELYFLVWKTVFLPNRKCKKIKTKKNHKNIYTLYTLT